MQKILHPIFMFSGVRINNNILEYLNLNSILSENKKITINISDSTFIVNEKESTIQEEGLTDELYYISAEDINKLRKIQKFENFHHNSLDILQASFNDKRTFDERIDYIEDCIQIAKDYLI